MSHTLSRVNAFVKKALAWNAISGELSPSHRRGQRTPLSRPRSLMAHTHPSGFCYLEDDQSPALSSHEPAVKRDEEVQPEFVTLVRIGAVRTAYARRESPVLPFLFALAS